MTAIINHKNNSNTNNVDNNTEDILWISAEEDRSLTSYSPVSIYEPSELFILPIHTLLTTIIITISKCTHTALKGTIIGTDWHRWQRTRWRRAGPMGDRQVHSMGRYNSHANARILVCPVAHPTAPAWSRALSVRADADTIKLAQGSILEKKPQNTSVPSGYPSPLCTPSSQWPSNHWVP